MTETKVKEEYFNWLCDSVYNGKRSYDKLFRHLYFTDFYYTIPMDDNRAIDGIDLRYHFGKEKNHSDRIVSSFLDTSPCSVLEMMIALAKRCEDHIMYDKDIGDRTNIWFWEMIKNMGLEQMDDTLYNASKVDSILMTFLDRKYDYNGRGGLFYVDNPKYDMRKVEIWYQMSWYLNKYFNY